MPFSVRDVTSRDPIEAVESTYLKIVFVTSGWAEVSTARQTVSLAQGTVLTVPPSLDCRRASSEMSRIITVYAQPDFAADHIRWVRTRHPLVYQIRNALQDGAALQQLQLPTSTMATLAPLLVRLSLAPANAEHHAMLSSIFVLLDSTDRFSALGCGPLRRPRAEVIAAIGLMQAAPLRRWRVEELARAVSISPSQLSRLFRDQIGLSPAAYFNRVRANRMAEILSTREVSISEAAARAGWSRPDVATRAFMRQFGVSPRDYVKFTRLGRRSMLAEPRQHRCWESNNASLHQTQSGSNQVDSGVRDCKARS